MEAKPRTILGNLSIGITVLLAAGVLTAIPAIAGTSVPGTCVSASIDEPIRLPTGEEHPSGRLTLCVTTHYSPVATLHKTYVDGRLIGLLQSKRGFSEGAEQRPFMVFNRDTEGRLNLYGFATPAGDRMATYHLGAGREDFRPSSMARRATAGAGALVLIANTGSVNAR